MTCGDIWFVQWDVLVDVHRSNASDATDHLGKQRRVVTGAGADLEHAHPRLEREVRISAMIAGCYDELIGNPLPSNLVEIASSRYTA
jgi:hypothetical protein